jgi:hypothetical protein
LKALSVSAKQSVTWSFCKNLQWIRICSNASSSRKKHRETIPRIIIMSEGFFYVQFSVLNSLAKIGMERNVFFVSRTHPTFTILFTYTMIDTNIEFHYFIIFEASWNFICIL